jgi:hypothetical protein
VISKQELLQLRTEWQLDIGVIEKDYVLGWVLAAIALVVIALPGMLAAHVLPRAILQE